MTELKKILVGIDPHQSRRGEFSPPTAEAAKQAIWLAERMAGEIMFLSALEPPADDELYTLFGEAERIAAEVKAACQTPLDELVEQAQQHGVGATSKIVYGTGWMELTREAIDGGHDMVIVGTRNQGIFHRALFGSTAMKLLQNCPAPVWVTKPEPFLMPGKILAASDFTPVSDKALRLAMSIGAHCRADMYLMHVVKQPYAELSDAGEVEALREEQQHEQDRAAAKQRLREQVARVVADGGPAEISIEDETYAADFAIAKYVDTHQINVLVLGTGARHGLAGFFVGNTAERLLSTVNCSVLAVKPDGFICPVPLELEGVSGEER